MHRFALIGAGGYIAPRHMKAIKDTGNELVAAMDVNDSVGEIDSYFPEAQFFREFERFSTFVDIQRLAGVGVDYVSIASPNYLHESHMRFALRSGANAICEKPVVLTLDELDRLAQLEVDAGTRINTILQLRLHPAIRALREKMVAEGDRMREVDLTYVTSRGAWYLESWKGDERKSGGIATNIGVHFFDMLHFLFGALRESWLHLATPKKASGYLEYDRARVRWFLSIDIDDVPKHELLKGKRTFRSITVDGQEIEFSDGFADLHTKSYAEVLAGRGFGIEDNRVAIETVSRIRQSTITKIGEWHPFVRRAGL